MASWRQRCKYMPNGEVVSYCDHNAYTFRRSKVQKLSTLCTLQMEMMRCSFYFARIGQHFQIWLSITFLLLCSDLGTQQMSIFYVPGKLQRSWVGLSCKYKRIVVQKKFTLDCRCFCCIVHDQNRFNNSWQASGVNSNETNKMWWGQRDSIYETSD